MPGFSFEADLWLYPGEAGWVFVTLPTETADEILDSVPSTGGFGSVKVEVRVGGTEWSTSLFPDRRAGSFVLPVRRAVREAESLEIGDAATFALTVVWAGGAEGAQPS